MTADKVSSFWSPEIFKCMVNWTSFQSHWPSMSISIVQFTGQQPQRHLGNCEMQSVGLLITLALESAFVSGPQGLLYPKVKV